MLHRSSVLLTFTFASLFCVMSPSLSVAEEEAVFSGPQAGEALPALKLQGVYDDQAGVEFDPVADGKTNPMVIVFVHKITRPGLGLVRGVTRYAKTLEDAPSSAAIAWLDDDKAKAEQFLNRTRKSLNLNVPVGIAVDGGEGPGAYGLNRNVELTILIAKDGKVVSNFALIQPSMSDGLQIAKAFAKAVGKEPPTAEELQKIAYPGQRMNAMRRQRAAGRPQPARPAKADTDSDTGGK